MPNNCFNLIRFAHKLSKCWTDAFGAKKEKMNQKELIVKMIGLFNTFPEIKSTKLHGSMTTANFDKFSDIDFQIDVSGIDNGNFMLKLPEILSKNMPIGYVAFAPRFIPDLYLTTIYFKDTDIFNFVDIECIATPHIKSITKEEIKKHAYKENVFLKLSINVLKGILRNKPNYQEILGIYSILYPTGNKTLELDKLKKCFQYFLTNKNIEIQKVANNAIKILNKEKCPTTAST